MPVDVQGQAVDVLVELPGQSRLADAGGTHDREQPRASPLHGAVEELLDEPQLAVAPHQLGLQAVAAVHAERAGDRPLRPPNRDGLGLALDHVLAGIAVGDGGGAGGPGGAVDVDRAGFSEPLDAGRGVDAITDDDALLHAVHGDRLAGDDPDAGREPLELVGFAEGVDCVDQLEAGPDGALGVVLEGDRDPPHGHDGVADELLDRAAVASDDGAGVVEVAREQLAHDVGVERLGAGREAHQVAEDHRDDAELAGDRDLRRRPPRRRLRLDRDGGAAGSAELLPGCQRCATGVAPPSDRSAALTAEALVRSDRLATALAPAHTPPPFAAS